MGRIVATTLGWMVVSLLIGRSTAAAQAGSRDLARLAARLHLSSEAETAAWFQRLRSDGAVTEHLVVLSAAGETIAERTGTSAAVRIDRQLDALLLRSDAGAILIHNHPRSVGFSAADIGQLSKAGVAAIVAIAEDRSVYIAAAGAALSGALVEQQYADAKADVVMRLRAESSARHVPAASIDLQVEHLVARTLASAGVIQYWFVLRGDSRESYVKEMNVFRAVVAGAAAHAKDRERIPPIR